MALQIHTSYFQLVNMLRRGCGDDHSRAVAETAYFGLRAKYTDRYGITTYKLLDQPGTLPLAVYEQAHVIPEETLETAVPLKVGSDAELLVDYNNNTVMPADAGPLQVICNASNFATLAESLFLPTPYDNASLDAEATDLRAAFKAIVMDAATKGVIYVSFWEVEDDRVLFNGKEWSVMRLPWSSLKLRVIADGAWE